MTPKEKAEELVDKFRNELKWVELDYPIDLYRDTKQCALIAVDEILSEVPETIHGWVDQPHNILIVDNPKRYYWQQVKTEIELL
jgi:hypothetical protein